MNRSKPYKQLSKVNKKKKVITESDTGELVKVNSGKRFPILSLPEIVTSHVIAEYRRFVNNGGAVNANLTIQDLLNQFTISVTNVLLYPYIAAIRIKKLRLLSPVTTQGTSITASMLPQGNDSSNNNFNCVPEKYLDTSASIDIPAYLALTPSLDTPLGSWHFSTTVNGNLVKIVAPPGSTLDILFEYIFAVDAPSAYTRAVAGAVVGQLYAANILTNFVPVGRTVI